jgi:glycosyltransferase involved in cell wall biosynthesis
MSEYKASVIISFYNNIDKLKLLLAGLQMQKFNSFEAIIADDGSKTEVVEQIRAIAKNYTFPIQHIWHEDIGWRKNVILNKAITASKGEVLIFIDGDCIPHPKFVMEHYNNREDMCALAGRRVNMSKNVSDSLTEKKIRNGYLQGWGFINLIFQLSFRGKNGQIENGFYIGNQNIRNKIRKYNRGLIGCNFSIQKKDLLVINGFDERYTSAYIGEDTDIEVRLRNAGGKDKSVKHIAIVYHCFHPLRKYENVCFDIFNANKNNKVSYTPYGIIKDSVSQNL